MILIFAFIYFCFSTSDFHQLRYLKRETKREFLADRKNAFTARVVKMAYPGYAKIWDFLANYVTIWDFQSIDTKFWDFLEIIEILKFSRSYQNFILFSIFWRKRIKFLDIFKNSVLRFSTNLVNFEFLISILRFSRNFNFFELSGIRKFTTLYTAVIFGPCGRRGWLAGVGHFRCWSHGTGRYKNCDQKFGL